MENNINLDAHSSLIIADGSIVEINGQKVLLTLVRDADAPEPKKIDLHKDSWGVYNDGSQRFMDTVINWLNENKNQTFIGDGSQCYYGIDKENDIIAYIETDRFTHILTLDEFCALAYPETSEKGSEWTNVFMKKEHLGKWVRCRTDAEISIDPTVADKWYQIFNPRDNHGYGITNDTGWIDPKRYFDMENLLDYNPETLIGKYWNGAKITEIYLLNELGTPYFNLEGDKGSNVACADITPSDVTDTPPLPSLKYEDCFERVKPTLYFFSDLSLHDNNHVRQDAVKTERQAKQLAATIKLMTIMHDANGDWIPKEGENRQLASYDESTRRVIFMLHRTTFNSPIYFRDHETAQRAYEANKEIFHDYFGIGGGE